MTDDYMLQMQYRIEIRNESDDVITPCLYWTIAGDTTLQSVAWFSGAAAATTRLVCEFTFVPGFLCLPSPPKSSEVFTPQTLMTSPVEYSFNNSVQLSYANSKFVFGTQQPYGSRSTLYLRQDSSVPNDAASVGIVVSSFAALVTPSKASTMLSVPLALQLNVGIANVSRGAILDLSEIQKTQVIQLPQNVRAMFIAYTNDEQFTMSQYAPRLPQRELVQESA